MPKSETFYPFGRRGKLVESLLAEAVRMTEMKPTVSHSSVSNGLPSTGAGTHRRRAHE